MTEVLVLGAGRQIARWAIEMLGAEDVELTLLLRDARAWQPSSSTSSRTPGYGRTRIWE